MMDAATHPPVILTEEECPLGQPPAKRTPRSGRMAEQETIHDAARATQAATPWLHTPASPVALRAEIPRVRSE